MRSTPRLRFVALVALAATIGSLTGCSPGLYVESRGATDAPYAKLRVAVQPAYAQDPVPGLMVEIVDDEGELAARFFTEETAREIPDLPAGTYTIRIHADEIDAGVLEQRFSVAEGDVVAIGFRDPPENPFSHVDWGQVAEGTATFLGVALVITLRVGLIVLTCGCAGG